MKLLRILAMALALGSTPALAQTNQGSSPLSISKGGTGVSSLGTGVASFLSSGALSVSNFNGGSGASGSTFLRGDGTWAAPAASLVSGSTGISSGTSGRVLYDNAGVLGEYTITGSGSVVMSTGPTVSGLTVNNSIAGSAFGTNVATALGTATGSANGFPRIVATGTIALGTSAISSGACSSAATASATGTATTDVIDVGFNTDPTAVTGYSGAAMLAIVVYPSADTVNVKQCNLTSNSITPSALTLNWRVRR